MEYTVKGITFNKNELDTLTLDQLQEGAISSHHLFYFTPLRPFLMLRAGEFISAEFIEKYRGKGVESFYALNIVSDADLGRYRKMLVVLKTSKQEIERKRILEEFYILLVKDYWISPESMSILVLITAFYDEFYSLPSSVISMYYQNSLVMYNRALVRGCTSVLVAMANGLTEFNFLKDLYNSSFLMDYSLVEQECSYTVLAACESERNHPGSGLAYLEKSTRPQAEIDMYRNHPSDSQEAALKYQEYFSYPEMIDVIKFHHEKQDGTGFPKGYFYSSLSSWEMVLSLSDYLIPYEEKIYMNNDGVHFFKKLIEQLEEMKDLQLLGTQKILNNFKSRLHWAVNQIKLEIENAIKLQKSTDEIEKEAS